MSFCWGTWWAEERREVSSQILIWNYLIGRRTQSVVPTWKHLPPFLHGPCLTFSWLLKLILEDCYSVCALPASLFPFAGSRLMYTTEWMDPDCNTRTTALQWGTERSVPYTPWDLDMGAPRCLFAFASRVAALSTGQQWAVEEVQDRATQGLLRCLSTVGRGLGWKRFHLTSRQG